MLPKAPGHVTQKTSAGVISTPEKPSTSFKECIAFFFSSNEHLKRPSQTSVKKSVPLEMLMSIN